MNRALLIGKEPPAALGYEYVIQEPYEAVVIGNLKEDRGTVDAPLGRSPKDRKKMAIVPDGRRAVTHYEVIARYPGYTHVRCKLETGRTHQIRVHMASLGHPIAGDEVYGPSKSKVDLGGQCLHARQLSFLHPADGQPRLVEIELPAYFRDFLDKLGRMS
jgi:23S rRNA pseudouridine1911/1915/1917 synthase